MFGFSCLDFLSCVRLDIDICNHGPFAISRSSEEKLRDLMSELTIIANACERVASSLDVCFLSDDELLLQSGKLSAEKLDYWFRSLGQYECSGTSFDDPTLSQANLKYRAGKLRRDLEHKVKRRCLVLVCQITSGAVLKEVFLDTIRLCHDSNCKLLVGEPKGNGNQNCRFHDIGSQHRRALPDRQVWRGQEFETLRGSVNTITIGLGHASSLLMRQFHSSDLMCSEPSSCADHRKQILEIRCKPEELSDCRLWSILRIIEGERWTQSEVDSTTSRLNSRPLLKRSACDLENALKQGSPARQGMTLKTLTWIAWSMRPLEPEEMFAALATRTDIDTIARYKLTSSETVCPATDDELISLCPELLEVKAGRVAFRHEHHRSLVRSPWATSFGFLTAEAAHESLAAVCLGHLGCIHPQTILRPWIRTGSMLRHEIRHCYFRSYCTNHWQDHYRAAEPSSRKLVSILHHILDSAFNSGTVPLEPEDSYTQGRMSTSVCICSLWDLQVLGRTYLEMGADVDRAVGLNESPLHIAAANSSTNMLRLLLDRGANPELRDTSGHTALQQACIAGALDVAALLLQRGADPESSGYQPSCSVRASLLSSQTPLHLAATYGHVNVVQALLEAGSNIQASGGDSNSTALHFAVEHGSEDIVRYLMDWGADLEAKNALSETALKIAIYKRHDAIVKLLIQKGARCSTSTEEERSYVESVFGREFITSSVKQFQSLSIEETILTPEKTIVSPEKMIMSPDVEILDRANTSGLPVIVMPTSCTRFNDAEDSVSECGWTIVDKMEIDA